ncbi:MAG: hypothetical protein ACE5F1_02820 [Planctomycetota bacterium]
MKRRRTVTLPLELLPRSPLAIAHVVAEISRRAPEQILHLEEAWMLEALSPERARDLAGTGLLEIGREYVRLDSYCPGEFRPVNRSLARTLENSLPGCECVASPAPADEVLESHSERAGLCLNHRDGLARLARAPGFAGGSPELLKALMPALTPAGIGGFGDRGARALSMELIRSACRVAGAETPREDAPRGAKRFGKRVQSQLIETRDLELRWSRSRGLSWRPPGLRETFRLLSLEIQTRNPSSDKAAFGFQPGHPGSPRLFEVAHMQPVLRASDAERELLRLQRELKTPSDEPQGRLCRVAWELDVSVSLEVPRLRIAISLSGLPPGQRCRLRVPVPFHPRPARLPVVEPDGSIGETEKEGAFPALPVRGPVTLSREGTALRVEGPGLAEVEVLAFKNDHVLAITLIGGDGEGSFRRDFVLSWERRG